MYRNSTDSGAGSREETDKQHFENRGTPDSGSNENRKKVCRDYSYNKDHRQFANSSRNTNSSFKGRGRDSIDHQKRSCFNPKNFLPHNSEEENEFRKCEHLFKSSTKTSDVSKVTENTMDLFKVSDDYSLGHCVAEDMNMGSGIAVNFRYQFKQVDKLLGQHQTTGGLAILEEGKRYIYYLVTKRFSSGKPTNSSLFASLLKLRDHMKEHNVQKLALPKIGCGLDRLDWSFVKFMLEYVFQGMDVEICIACLEPLMENSPGKRHRNCKVTNVVHSIEATESETVMLYFSSEDGYISDEMKLLEEKFKFTQDFTSTRKTLGQVIFNKYPYYLLCGCIVKKNSEDMFDFTALSKCLSAIQKENKYGYLYYAFQALRDRDRTLNYKIINILRNNLRGVDVYVCWPNDLTDLMSYRDKEELGLNKNANQSFEDDSNCRNSSFSVNETGRQSIADTRRTKSAQFHFKNYSEGNESQIKNHSWTDSASEWKPDRAPVASAEELPQIEMSKAAPIWNTNPRRNPALVKGKDRIDTSKSPGVKGNTIKTMPQTPGLSSKLQKEENWDDPKEPMLYSADQNQISQPDQQGTSFQHTYENYVSKIESNEKISKKVKEQNVTNVSKPYSRVCYVTENFTFLSGVAPGSALRSIGKFLKITHKSGSLVFEREENNFVYYLIINPENDSSKTVFEAIEELFDHATKNRVTKIVIPGFEIEVKGSITQMYEFLFQKGQQEIVMANVPDLSNAALSRLRKMSHVKSPVYQAKKDSAIIYLASRDAQFTDEMKSLSKKYKFVDEFENAEKILGSIIKFKHQDNILYGCIVRDKIDDEVDFEALQKSIEKIQLLNQKDKMPVFIQALSTVSEGTNTKIITILLHYLNDGKINMCWPGPLRASMPNNNM